MRSLDYEEYIETMDELSARIYDNMETVSEVEVSDFTYFNFMESIRSDIERMINLIDYANMYYNIPPFTGDTIYTLKVKLGPILDTILEEEDINEDIVSYFEWIRNKADEELFKIKRDGV